MSFDKVIDEIEIFKLWNVWILIIKRSLERERVKLYFHSQQGTKKQEKLQRRCFEFSKKIQRGVVISILSRPGYTRQARSRPPNESSTFLSPRDLV